MEALFAVGFWKDHHLDEAVVVVTAGQSAPLSIQALRMAMSASASLPPGGMASLGSAWLTALRSALAAD